ncbi:hypothetical protein FHS21_004664 [Phyllobacterium trifolii]|uniref:Uncharacterized protein n=1 Tax=Phyllobacterium trifolii TaxID=300193 RepID=A0A839UHV3_9HYPH|nr:hypothetical protein [Phyllobacterium trifolii]MBB3148221.1 hypothetical protein [Phyllobacterium trifolii]
MNETARKHDDDVERLIAEHNGDVQAAITVLLSERSFLMKELEYASLAMGYVPIPQTIDVSPFEFLNI